MQAWWRVVVALVALATANGYLVLVPTTAPAGHAVLDAAVRKLGSERRYSIDVHRTANFVHHLLQVNRTSGLVTLRKKLRCDGVLYPNIFTFYVDSTSDRIRDIDYYSLPVRVLVTGEDCSRKNSDLFDIDFDRVYDQNDAAEEYDDEPYIRDKRDSSRMSHPDDVDWRLMEDEEFSASHFSIFSTANPWNHAQFEDYVSYKYSKRHKRSHSLLPFDMSIDVKIADAKQWISETYASFSIPTTDKWNGICLKRSQFVNSLTAFLPRSVQQSCKVQFLDVSDPRFSIENSQGDLVSSDDLCIMEPIWKVTILFTFNCEKSNIVDSDHRLKIVYHHQELNNTDIARRVKRELRNQSPYFEQALYVASVAEEQEPGAVVTTVRARDPENSPVTYTMSSLLDSRSAGMFDVDPHAGTVTTRARLDRERLDVHYFRVVAQDDSFPPRSGTTTLQINVLDCNDHSPVFERQQYEAWVREAAPAGTVALTVTATDADAGANAEVEYSIESITAEPPKESVNPSPIPAELESAFRIDGRSGAIVTRTGLDREVAARYSLVVMATDMAAPPQERLSNTATVYINIEDDNDNYPQFSERAYTVTLDEDISVADNPVIATVRATDADVGANAAIRYAIIGGNNQLQFSIDSLSGDIALLKAPDYEQARNYRLVVRAQDGGSPSRSNTTQVLVNIRDVNDNSPRFYTTHFQEAVSENVPVGYSIVRVQAYDADEGVNADITYNLTSTEHAPGTHIPIAIDPRTGWVHTTNVLDREDHTKYTLQVTATDGGVPPRSATASVVVVVQDVNDNDPKFSAAQYDAALGEDEPPGTPVISVLATDRDEDNRLHYEITGGNTRGRFAITTQNGRGLITVAQPLDFKQERRYVLSVTATDGGGRTDTALVNINVTDANNYAPVFENAPYSASVLEDAPIGTTVLVVSATDGDVGVNAQIQYSISSEAGGEGGPRRDEFIINPHTGAITTNKALDRETMSGYLLTVTARDGGAPPLSDTTDVEVSVADVNDNAPLFQQQLYSANVPEDALLGTSVTQVSATDLDVGLNGRVHFELDQSARDEGSFNIDPSSGVIRTNKALDRESTAFYNLKVLAIDAGSPSLTSTVVVHVKIEDMNDSPPVFSSETLTFYIAENSPVGTTVAEILAVDHDEGDNAVVHYSIKGGEDASSFSLETRQGSDRAYLITMVELDYESPHKKFELYIRASSPPLWSDAKIEILVTDVNDNAPMLKDFQVVFNNYKDCFPVGPFGKVPAFDADVTDKLYYRIVSGNNANLILLNSTTGDMTLSPQLNTNVPKLASMEISVTDGVNEVKAIMSLSVRLITSEMLMNSVTIRVLDLTAEQFISGLLPLLLAAVAAVVPCPVQNVHIFSLQDDPTPSGPVLNISLSARRSPADAPHGTYYSPEYLRERVYLHRATLAKLATVQVLPFEDDICVQEPCLNFERCSTRLRFGAAAGWARGSAGLFRSIRPVATANCQCPAGFTGVREVYMCDTEVDLCHSSPCRHGGTCHTREEGYTCLCAHGYTGDNCETALTNTTCLINNGAGLCRGGSQCVAKIEGGVSCQGCGTERAWATPLCEARARHFPHTAYLTLRSLTNRNRLRLQLRFATQSPTGLLLYNGRYNGRHDFIALELIPSGIQFSFSTGSRPAYVTVPGQLSDGNWHTVHVEYYNRTATVWLDDCDKQLVLAAGDKLGAEYICANTTTKLLPARCDIPTETCHRFLDLTGPLQLGGLSGAGHAAVQNKDFVGCISDLYIDHKFIDLNSYVSDNGTVPGCGPLRDRCSSSPCAGAAGVREGGRGACRDAWGTYVCTCPEGYTGKDCSEATSLPWRFNGDGFLSFNPLLRPIQLPWLNAISIRTRQSDAFIMAVRLGQNTTVVISLKSGRVHFTVDGVSSPPVTGDVADGEWHRVALTWRGADVLTHLDYGAKLTTTPMMADKIQGQYIGKILVGGPDSTAGLLASELGYFEGCIQDVRVGTEQSVLTRPTVRENVRDGCESRADCQLMQCPPHSKCVESWDSSECVCAVGYVGARCVPACQLRPCPAHAHCALDSNANTGYNCTCEHGFVMAGESCIPSPPAGCPPGWWGAGARCGPCLCDVTRNYHPHCDTHTGRCRCKENHYSPGNSSLCVPCGCSGLGAADGACDGAGVCSCLAGAAPPHCATCLSHYAELTAHGCTVIYDACPRVESLGVWWPRTKFGETARVDCPQGSVGSASRMCSASAQVPWQEPDMFNCTALPFRDLHTQLQKLESGELTMNSFVSIRLSEQLLSAAEGRSELFGSDVTIAQKVLSELLKYELKQEGLNLTHSQDKDYVSNIIKSTNIILNEKYSPIWDRIQERSHVGPQHLMQLFDKYIQILAQTQHDTYTSPFEIVTSDVAMGLDIVTAESIFGFEPPQLTRSFDTFTTERVILPDTSNFIHSPLNNGFSFSKGLKAKKLTHSPTISFPKYNNYVRNKTKFDQYSRVLVPLDLLGLTANGMNEASEAYESRAVFSYVQYSRNSSRLMPILTDASVTRGWDVNLTYGTSIMQIAVFVPAYLSNEDVDSDDGSGTTYTNRGNHNANQIPNNLYPHKPWSRDDDDNTHDHAPVLIQPYKKDKHIPNKENEAILVRMERDGPRAMALSTNGTSKKLVYKSLSGIRLKSPIRLQMWLDVDYESFGPRMNPQCVHWSTVKGAGVWSRVGCHTEVDLSWSWAGGGGGAEAGGRPLLVNCTCNHLSTFTVLVNQLQYELIPEPSLLESVASYTAFSISLPLLFITFVCLCALRGEPTTSNSIHKHEVFCLFVSQLLYLVALKTGPNAMSEHACKLMSMSLQFWWTASVAWLACECHQLRRLFREVRDVNHCGVRAHCLLAYSAPALLLALSAALSAGTTPATICWVSMYDMSGAAWWVVAGCGAGSAAALLLLGGAARAAAAPPAAATHLTSQGDLRMLLAATIVCLPLVVTMWSSAVVLGGSGRRRRPALAAALSVAVATHAIVFFAAHVLFNTRVARNLKSTFLRCVGRKVPLVDTSVTLSTTTHNIHTTNRSSLAYHAGAGRARPVAVCAASTTSRSTTDTSGPYRSDGARRLTSTSTSNYNTSNSDMPAYLRGFDSSLRTGKESRSSRQQAALATEGSESESEAEARSLSLASTHSSDNEDSAPPHSHRDGATASATSGFLPNITEGAPLSLTPRWQNEGGAPPRPLPRPDVTSHAPVSPVMEDVYTAHLPPTHRYGLEDELMYGMTLPEVDKPYDPNYPISPTMYRLSSTYPNYLSSRTSDYGYSPTKYLGNDNYGSRDLMSRELGSRDLMSRELGSRDLMSRELGSRDLMSRDLGVTTRDHEPYPSRDYRDSGIATLLKNDYQRKMEYGDYNDRMSETSDKHHSHDKYLFPYTAEEDHATTRPPFHQPEQGESQQAGAPLASMGETSEKSTTEDDAETRV